MENNIIFSVFTQIIMLLGTSMAREQMNITRDT